MLRRRVRTSVEQFQPFERGLIVGLREAKWTNRRMVAHVWQNVSVVCRCFQQLYGKHSYTRRLGSGWPRSTDARQDRRTVQAAMVSRTASREEIRTHVAPAVTPWTVANSQLAAGLRSRVPLVRLPLTSRHGQVELEAFKLSAAQKPVLVQTHLHEVMSSPQT